MPVDFFRNPLFRVYEKYDRCLQSEQAEKFAASSSHILDNISEFYLKVHHLSHAILVQRQSYCQGVDDL